MALSICCLKGESALIEMEDNLVILICLETMVVSGLKVRIQRRNKNVWELLGLSS